MEESIRELFFLFKNDGFMTECFCGYGMHIQYHYILNEKLHRLVYTYLEEHKMSPYYEINIKVINGLPNTSLKNYLKEISDGYSVDIHTYCRLFPKLVAKFILKILVVNHPVFHNLRYFHGIHDTIPLHYIKNFHYFC